MFTFNENVYVKFWNCVNSDVNVDVDALCEQGFS